MRNKFKGFNGKYSFIKYKNLITERNTRHRTPLINRGALALKSLRFVFDTLHFLESIHVRLHDLSKRLHHLSDVGLLHHSRQLLVLGFHSNQAVVLVGLGMWWSAFSGFRFVDSIIYKLILS